MRMSCNGCRVLRKGCSDDCSIRPCLQWIKSPESQANATVFLAKFYGRAGLMNLLSSGPDHLRPAIFRSLLYEACGRIVNPIYGSVGLLWSGSWQLCQAAVEAVLKGAPIMQIPTDTAANSSSPPLKAYDIRHVIKDSLTAGAAAAGTSGDLHKVSAKSRPRFKRSAAAAAAGAAGAVKNKPSASHESSAEVREENDHESAVSTEAASHVSQGSEPSDNNQKLDEGGSAAAEEGEAEEEEEEEEELVGLELTLGLVPVSRRRKSHPESAARP